MTDIVYFIFISDDAGCQSARAAALIGFYSMEWRIQSPGAVQCQANSLCWSHIPLIYLKLQKLKNSITPRLSSECIWKYPQTFFTDYPPHLDPV